MIPVPETYAYLKHAGAMLDTKVHITRRYGLPVIDIEDCSFKTVRAALSYLQIRVAPTIADVESAEGGAR